jgi:hypothetical protein
MISHSDPLASDKLNFSVLAELKPHYKLLVSDQVYETSEIVKKPNEVNIRQNLQLEISVSQQKICTTQKEN